MIFEEKLIDSERIYEGAIMNVRRDRVTAPKGIAYREIVEHNVESNLRVRRLSKAS